MNNELWLIWKSPETRRRYKVGILVKKQDSYVFEYSNPELNEAKEAGFTYFPGFLDTNKKYENTDLFINIATRLPNKTRTDYLEILNIYNLEKDSDEFKILKATKGRLLTDNYEFVPAFDLNKIEFNVAGTSHCQDIEKCKQELEVNKKLLLEPEPENKSDPNAIKIIYNSEGKKYKLGYVPRYYSKQLLDELKKKIEYSALIQSLNFESALSDEDITANVKLIFNI